VERHGILEQIPGSRRRAAVSTKLQADGLEIDLARTVARIEP
jgi:hypothetical protein